LMKSCGGSSPGAAAPLPFGVAAVVSSCAMRGSW
jgi:hypothetical protein